MVNINIEVPDEVHKKIKILSAMKEKPIKDLIIETLEQRVKRDEI